MSINSSRTANGLSWLPARVAVNMLVWFCLSLAFSLVFFRDFWVDLPRMLSLNWVLGQHHASFWGVLALCLLFLWLKRKEVWRGISDSPKSSTKSLKTAFALYILNFDFLIGMALVLGALLVPFPADFVMFQILLVWLGLFIIFFDRKAAKIPTILLLIYGVAIAFPLAIERFVAEAYIGAVLSPLTALMNLLGYPLQNSGQLSHLVTSSGEPITVAITVACAGPVTMGVFIALFALMTLDMPLPPKKAIGLFVFGIAGTWLQSFIRLIILMLVGYYAGEDALWTAHFWSIYILFPLWYLLFVCVYFREARWLQPKVC